jgi:valyl-tRNA synthetase
MNVPQNKTAQTLFFGPEEEFAILDKHRDDLKRLAMVSSLAFATSGEKPQGAVSAFVGKSELVIPLGDLIDMAVEKARIVKEIERLEKILNGLNMKLNNPEFVQKAPEEVVEKERRKQSDFLEKLNKLRENLRTLEGTSG